VSCNQEAAQQTLEATGVQSARAPHPSNRSVLVARIRVAMAVSMSVLIGVLIALEPLQAQTRDEGTRTTRSRSKGSPAAAPAGGEREAAPAPAAPARMDSGQPIALNFKDADIDSVVGAFGHLLNRTFIIDPRVRGKITLETPRPVSAQKA